MQPYYTVNLSTPSLPPFWGPPVFFSGSPPKITLAQYIQETWLPLEIDDGSRSANTVSFYRSMAKMMIDYFRDTCLLDLTSDDIRQYFRYLRTSYVCKSGKQKGKKGASPTTVHDQYFVLNLVFQSAENRGVVSANPMKSISCPKSPKKNVDAFTWEQAHILQEALSACSALDFRCILQLLLYSGIRRGECVGLRWLDIDFKESTIHIQQNVTRVAGVGIVIGPPKTVNSIRTIPIPESTQHLLKLLYQEEKSKYPNIDLRETYIFHRKTDLFKPIDPSSLTKKVKKFMVSHGLPSFSPHDLRHSCASLMLDCNVNIKRVQDLLGHSNASTTLNSYVRQSSIDQLRESVNTLADSMIP